MTKSTPTLRFSPTAWAKLLYLRDVGDTEIGGFGISAKDDLLFVEDVELVEQSCTWVRVAFDDDAVADYFDRQTDAGHRPEGFGRIWVHTHPGRSAEPSGVDEATFSRVFGRCDWAILFIVAKEGEVYARLRYNVGPGSDIKLRVEIDYSRPFAGSSEVKWREDYLAQVRVPPPEPPRGVTTVGYSTAADERDLNDDWWRDSWGDYADFDGTSHKEEYGFIRDF